MIHNLIELLIMKTDAPVRMYNAHSHLVAAIPQLCKVFLFSVIFIFYVEKSYCETLVAGQNVTLLCSHSSSREDSVWIENPDAEFPKFPRLLSTCKENEEKCIDEKLVDLRFSAFHNNTFSWITLLSDTPNNYIIACRIGGDVIQSFSLTFIDGNTIPNPQCDVFPYEDTSKVKFNCEVVNTQRVKAELKIIGAGENIHESPNLVYSIVDYDRFINVSDVKCQMDIRGIKRSCRFPRGISISDKPEGDDVIFEIEANFEIDDHVIDWQLVEIDRTVVDTINHSLWFSNEKNYMLFRNISSRNDTEGIIVTCHISGTNENQSASDLVGIGFVSLEYLSSENPDETQGKTESSNGSNTGKDDINGFQQCNLYVLIVCAVLGVLVISSCIAFIVWLILKSGKKYQCRDNSASEASGNVSRGDRVMAAEERPQGVQPVGDTMQNKVVCNESNNQADNSLDVYAISSSISETCSPQDDEHGFDNAIYYVVDRSTPTPDIPEEATVVACDEAECDVVDPGSDKNAVYAVINK